MGSYIHLQQLELEEAMTLQVEAAALPDVPYKALCLNGETLGEQGISLKTPLKDQIQEAIDNPEVFARRKAKLEITKQISGKLWEEVERRR